MGSLTDRFLSAFGLFILRPLLYRRLKDGSPEADSVFSVPGLGDKVDVRWDRYAVPHVFAFDEHDLFLVQGYLHARERLWQMDLMRRFFCGRLAEIFGDYSVPWRDFLSLFRGKHIAELDYFMRLMGIHRSALDAIQLLPEEHVSRLQAYSDGVNRFIERARRGLPWEFRLLHYEPEPWRPEDSLTIGKGFAFFLSTALFTRLALVSVAAKLSGDDEKFRSLFPFYPPNGPTVTQSTPGGSEGLLRFFNGTFHSSDWSPSGHGSNNWAIAPSHSSTGRAILCNDPHLRLALPSTWYLMHLTARAADPEKSYEVWGASVPGSPCVHLGHNRRIAWGVTAAVCDDAELYREKIHPADPDRYLAGNGWRQMQCRTETFRIRGKRKLQRVLRFTRHGPVISDFSPNGSPGEVLAFRWTAHDCGGEFEALYGVNHARDWNEFLGGLSHQCAPTLNYVYADAGGNIGYTLTGKIPLRRQLPSLMPLEGWREENEWNGYVPFNELPRLYNPPEGLLATANHRIADVSYPYYLSHFFEPPHRICRIRQLLTAHPLLSPDDMAAMQEDVLSLHATDLLEILRTDLERITGSNPVVKNAAQRLLTWDGHCADDSVEAAIFHVFHHRLMRRLLIPSLGEDLFAAYVEILNQCLAPVDRILRDARSPWFTACPRQRLVNMALEEACQELQKKLGAEMSGWQWGKIHMLTLRHALGRIPVLKHRVSVGPFPSPGSGTTLNLGFYRHSQPYRHVVGASLRMIIEFGEPTHLRCTLPSGQSGHPLSPHYRDQTELWRRGDYLSLSASESEMKSWPLWTFAPRP